MAYKFPLAGLAQQAFIAYDVDLTTSADVLIPNVPNNFCMDKVQIIGITQTGFSVSGSFTIGDNASSYDNMMSSVTISGAAIAGEYTGITLTTARAFTTGDVYTKITACTATTYTAHIVILGYVF